MNTSHFHKLHKKWTKKHRDIQRDLWVRHGEALHWATNNVKQISAGAMGGLMLLTAAPTQFLPTPAPVVATQSAITTTAPDKPINLSERLKEFIPPVVRELAPQEETRIGSVLSEYLGVPVAAELDGKRLNRSYGYIGQEQHLARFPGDTIGSHFDNAEDASKYASYGMAPGLGGWGYFAHSGQMTQEDNMREKYYIAVQTFLAPNYNERFAEYRDFFRFRKMLVVNPQNGKAVVAVIGDAGPAAWTGKHLGGSPEVMQYLERVDGAQKGPVLYFFIDDPENKVPLGPVSK